MKKIFFCFLFIIVNSSFAQMNVEFTKDNFRGNPSVLKEALKNIDDGDALFEKGTRYYKQALVFYSDANLFNPNSAILNFKMGQCFLFTGEKTNSLIYLEKALKLNPLVSSEIHYWLGRAYHLNMQWDNAINEFTFFVKVVNKENTNKILVENANKQIEECFFGKEFTKKSVRVFIDNLDIAVNSPLPDYNAVISADESELFFTSRRKNTTGGKTDFITKDFYEDIYISKKRNGEFAAAENIGSPVNTEEGESTIGLSADAQKLLVYYPSSNGDIYESLLNGTVWTKPEKLNKNINTDAQETSACYSANGKYLYFVSDREGGLGGKDIYVSTIDEKGKWGKAVNIGKPINTKYNEDYVFLHPDGKTLYFSSEGHKNIGGYDIFKSVLEKGVWSEPENIGYPINTVDDDKFFIMSGSGKHGYYSSIIPENGYGESDIYKITFMGDEKPMILDNEDNLLGYSSQTTLETPDVYAVPNKYSKLTLFDGYVLDDVSKEPIEATIEVVDNVKNEILFTANSNSATGKFLVCLPSGKNYGVVIKKENYLYYSENFNLPVRTSFQDESRTIMLKAIEVGNKIILKNLFFDEPKSIIKSESNGELERLKKLLNDFPKLKVEISGHTDAKGSDDYKRLYSERCAKAVVDYLVKSGISLKRLNYVGMGKEQPIATNDTNKGMEQNRRIEMKILGK